MKRKKCFKTVLSAILAAAMLVTAAPAEFSLNVQAAQTVEQTAQTVEETTQTVEETTQTVEETVQTGAGDTIDISSGYWGPTIDYGTMEAPGTGAVTIYYYSQNWEGDSTYPAGSVTEVWAKGSWASGWGDYVRLTAVPEMSGMFSYTFPLDKMGLSQSCEYGFTPNAQSTFDKDDCNTNTGGNSKILRNPVKDASGNLILYYYPSHGAAYPSNVTVKYRIAGTEDAYTDVPMALDAVHNKIYSASLTGLANGEYEYLFDVDGTQVPDTNNARTGRFSVVSIPPKDPSVVSPVAGKGEATFYYYGPTAGAVKVKGEMTGWSPKDMTYHAETGYWSVTLQMAPGTYQYGFEADGVFTADELNTSEKVGGNNVVTVTEAADTVSPVIEGKNVTFLYKDDAAEKVSVAGTMNGWTPNVDMMTKNTESGYWELTMENMAAGTYQYKLVVGESGWITDPLNANTSDGNSVFYVAGLEDKETDAIRGKELALPETLVSYNTDGTTENKSVTYELSDETKAAAYAAQITLTEANGKTTLTLAEDFPEEVKTFTLTATDSAASGTGNASTVTVSVVDAVYTYTIYYYDEEQNKDTAALWLWNTSGAGATAPTYFTEEEVLADGNTWMKTVVEASYTDVSIIPRAYDSWDWQDVERKYVNTDAAETATLYIVKDDGANIYTELPEIKKAEKRYLVVEYKRNDNTAENWYFYTWNSGYGGNVFVPFENKNGTWTAKVPVKQGLESIGYCIEKATAVDGEVTHWADKDGNDYICAMPADQNAVKIKMEEGKGIIHVYPYNTGYEIAPQDGKVHFYYRNDEAFAEGNTGGYAAVKIEINGTAYDMTFDAETQRYIYELENLTPGTYKYRYILKKENTSEPEYILDKYNEVKVTENETEYSVCEYQAFAAEAEAAMLNPVMDYNDNNVLEINFKGKDGADVSAMKAKSVTADLTALGGSAEAQIDPALMKRSVAVKEGTAAGEKTIPVTVYDQFNNCYLTETTVTVAERNKGTDFDWDEAVIYFTVTDRFFDGNTSNNGAGYDTSANGSSSYHGGDFAGLTQKLDYLKELGVNTIWITPIVANEMQAGLQTDVAGITSWGYHGYWASSFDKLDSHMGTEQEFKALLDAAHSRGMKIMVDVVLNHSGYEQEDYFNNILKDEDGNPVRMIRESSEEVSGSDQLSPLSGLPDFLTEKEEVRDLLVEWQSNWVSKYDIDYYRVDTVKHVDNTTWSAFKNALTRIDPDFKMIGEWAGAGYATDTGMLDTGRMDSLLDFDFNNQALDFVTGKLAAAESFLSARNAAISNTATLGSFLGSHDEDGFAYSLTAEKKVPQDKAAALSKVAASLQLTAKGQVVIYYGEEIGMTGANNYPYQTNRYDFDWALANDSNDMLQHYKKLLSIRKQYSGVFAKGTRTTIEASDADGVDVFARSYNGTTVYTGLNIKDTESTYTLTGQQAGAYLMDLYADELYRVDKDGNVTITIPAAADGGTAILVESSSGFSIETAAQKVYTGKAIKLTADELKVYYGTTPLKEGKDYSVSYKNNKAAGTATVTITGKGNYNGKDSAVFPIVAKDMTEEDVIISYQDNMIVTKSAQKPLQKVNYNGMKLGTKDYKAEYYLLDEKGERTGDALNSVKAAGDYEMVITGKGNYTGTVTKAVKLHTEGTYIKNTTILVNGTAKPYSTRYSGTAAEPEVSLKLKDKNKTVVGTDCYTVSYADNTEIGTAKITITGIPEKGFFGSVTKTFKITGTKLSAAAVVNTENWNAKVPYDVKTKSAVQAVDASGKNLVTLSGKGNYKDTVFTEGTDYTVSYSKNDKAGQATMIFTGIGKYTGTVTKKFTVSKVAFKPDDAKLTVHAETESSYAKKGSKVEVSVSYDGVPLTEGKDYKVSYKNNKTVTTDSPAGKTARKPQAVITGAGSFSGSIVKEFTIKATDLQTLTINAADIAYQNKKGNYKTVPVITEADGTKLVNNKDVTCSYYLVTENGETELTKNGTAVVGDKIKVVAAAKGTNYTGSISTVYEIKAQAVSKASVTVKAQVYTGKAITLTEEDFSKIKIGNTSLEMGKDYEITGYTNNINKGNAKVTIKGIGNYGQTKTVTFKITSRPVAWWWNLIH